MPILSWTNERGPTFSPSTLCGTPWPQWQYSRLSDAKYVKVWAGYYTAYMPWLWNLRSPQASCKPVWSRSLPRRSCYYWASTRLTPSARAQTNFRNPCLDWSWPRTICIECSWCSGFTGTRNYRGSDQRAQATDLVRCSLVMTTSLLVFWNYYSYN